MPHMIDETTGRAAIAYVGQKPWHGLGQELTPGASIDDWKRESGLAYTVENAPVTYIPDGLEPLMYPQRRVLYRSDTKAALSVVSNDYRVVQPGQIMDFFARLADIGGFELETAGALSGGRRVWALARVNDGAPVIGQDQVRPYLLLATSYDATMSTIGKFTAIRVVCNNTITMAVNTDNAVSDAPVTSVVRIPHSAKFDEDKMRLRLGIVRDAWEQWLVSTRRLAHERMTEAQADGFLRSLLPAPQNRPVQETRGYKAIMELFGNNALIGADLFERDSRWAMLNAVTEWVDHHKGRSNDTRLTSAWFGAGETIKTRAYELLAV